jgi:hypothetical protein
MATKTLMPTPATEPASPYDQDAIFHQNGPIEPEFINESVRALMRTMPLANPAEPRSLAYRRMYCALRALAALHPRDEIEVMLGVLAVAAYQASAIGWYVGMNLRQPHGESTRHIASAASAARTFDTLLKALERRQAKPLAIPPGRPPAREWAAADVTTLVQRFETSCAGEPETSPSLGPDPRLDTDIEWTDDALAIAAEIAACEALADENQGLDLVNTEGILPSGGIIVPDDPTPQQHAYIARRLGLSYRREHAENLRRGIRKYPQIRPIRAGDLIP